MGKLFGTDGIRGRANQYPLTPEMLKQIGRGVAQYFKNTSRSSIIIGKDTRESGAMIENGLVDGICSVGGDVQLVGVLPTPGVAYLTRVLEGKAGIVISASHNPYHDNGIKLFDARGYKLSDDVEAEIEAMILEKENVTSGNPGQSPGLSHRSEQSQSQYIDFLKQTLDHQRSLEGLKVCLDCSNGATSWIAPQVFEALGAETQTLFAKPDGRNINAGCGSQHPDKLIQSVIDNQADIGLAFDGDGDRLIVVDDRGAVISGDKILAICAHFLKQKGLLQNNVAVSTVMSNLGLRLAFKEMGIELVITDVGDRYVLAEMKLSGAVIGGEDSGHMIFLDHHTTGDGIYTALRLLEVLRQESRPLSELGGIMKTYPQVLVNIAVTHKPDLEKMPSLVEAVKTVEAQLGEEGRVLVRYSGTQLKCRVMVEGPGKEATRKYCEQIAEVVRAEIGAEEQ